MRIRRISGLAQGRQLPISWLSKSCQESLRRT
jgi:hypothetical protein